MFKQKKSIKSCYQTTLNFYGNPPQHLITLQEFELAAMQRLRILVGIEQSKLRTTREAEVIKMVTPMLKQMELNLHGSLDKLLDQRQRDHTSHFVLRLAYCKTVELRNWFVKQESMLFKIRFLLSSQEDRDKFLNQLPFTVDEMRRDELEKILVKTAGSQVLQDIAAVYGDQLSFIKTKWINVSDLVAQRLVLCFGGYAYVPSSMQSVLLTSLFANHLKQELEATAKILPKLDEDDRIMPILYTLAKQSVQKDYQFEQKGDQITANDVKKLFVHFPPCMEILYSTLVGDHHLKYQGRLQLGLFLKGIGLSLEEALIFWRNMFNNMNDDEYGKKNYAYNIRYNYGMEGKRTDYTPYSCRKVITTPFSGGDSHGCCFKNFSDEQLNDYLFSKIGQQNAQHIAEIKKKAKEGHYQLACTKFLEIKKGIQLMEAVDHPNRWYDVSMNNDQ